MDCEEFRELALDVLYDEADDATEDGVRQHASACAACRVELEGLRELRVSLQAWKIPSPRPVVRRLAPPPYFWAAAAAAALLLATGGAIGLSGVEVRYNRGPLVVQMGHNPEPPSAVPVAVTPVAEVAPLVAAEPSAVVPSNPGAALTDDEKALILARVGEMIRQSEARQQMVFRAGLTQLEDRSSRQRRYDLARIGAGLSYLDGRNGQQLARTTELMGYVLNASNRREP